MQTKKTTTRKQDKNSNKKLDEKSLNQFTIALKITKLKEVYCPLP